MEALIVIVLVSWIAFIALGMYVSNEKGRGSEEGFILTLLFGPFGILIAALLPGKEKPTPSPAKTQDEIRDIVERNRKVFERQRQKEEELAREIEEIREARKAAAMKRRIEKREGYLARGITPGPFAPIEAFGLNLLGWYRGLGDMGQMMVWAVCLAIPAASIAVMLFRGR